MPTQALDVIPIWAIYLLTVGLGWMAIELGIRLGRNWTRHGHEVAAKQENVGSLVAATLGLLAFLLVFMIGIASSRFDNRRQLVVAEANAIGTTYLRAGFLDASAGAEARTLLREYLDGRLAAAADPGRLPEAKIRAEEIHAALWAQAEDLARREPESRMAALYVEALNGMIDLHAVRLAAVFNRIPLSNWLAIVCVAFLTLALVGFNDGLGEQRSPIAEWVLILVFSAVLFLIVDLDRPMEGLMQVSQQPLIELRQQLGDGSP